MDAFEQKLDQAFFGFNGTAFKHADFDNRVALRAASGIEEVFFVQWEKTVGAFVDRVMQRVDDTGMDNVGEFFPNRDKMRADAVNFDLCHGAAASAVAQRIDGTMRGT